MTVGDFWKHIPGQNPADLSQSRLYPFIFGPVKMVRAPARAGLGNHSIFGHLEMLFLMRQKLVAKERRQLIVTEEISRYYVRYSKILRLVGWIYRFYNNVQTKRKMERSAGTRDQSD
uniref:Integrase core domain n=1 Tax=Triatoma infestans TaxID=30076 RepID=A0A170ZUC2_TRIIF